MRFRERKVALTNKEHVEALLERGDRLIGKIIGMSFNVDSYLEMNEDDKEMLNDSMMIWKDVKELSIKQAETLDTMKEKLVKMEQLLEESKKREEYMLELVKELNKKN